MKRFFSYDPIDGQFQLHDTLEQARDAAEAYFDYCLQEAGCDGWPENTDGICYGEVKGIVALIEKITRPPKSELDEDGRDGAGNDWSNPDWSSIEKRELRKVDSASYGGNARSDS